MRCPALPNNTRIPCAGWQTLFTDEEVELFIWLFDADMDTTIEWQEFERIVVKAKGTVLSFVPAEIDISSDRRTATCTASWKWSTA